MAMFGRLRWIVVHLLVAALAVAFVNLGFWQLRRLDERRADNALIESNMATDPEPLATTLDRFGQDPKALRYRRVVVEGEYRPAYEVVLTPRSRGGQPGHDVVTPLEMDDGQAVLVDRGWVPFGYDDPPITAAPPTKGPVSVTGILLPTQTAARAGSPDGSTHLTYLSSVDVDRLQGQIPLPLVPFSVQLIEQDPAPAALPAPAPLPEVSEGSHLSYAWQWFSFTAILLLGYPLLLRRSLRSAADADDDSG
jgi:surfeit locus 1 family protein